MSDSTIRDDDFDIYSDPHYLTELISDDELKASIERSYHIERDPGEAGGWVYHTLLSALGRILRLEAQIALLSAEPTPEDIEEVRKELDVLGGYPQELDIKFALVKFIQGRTSNVRS